MNLRLSVTALSFACMLAALGQIIEKGKSVQIRVTGITEEEQVVINGTYPISEDGMLNLPLIGKIPAAGLGFRELEKTLNKVSLEKGIDQRAAFQVIAAPECGVGAREAVTVGGQVKKPGFVAMMKGLTLGQAIQAAGGIDFFGQVKRVKLTRNGEMRIYDLSEERFKSILIQKNDTIEVTAKRPSDP